MPLAVGVHERNGGGSFIKGREGGQEAAAARPHGSAVHCASDKQEEERLCIEQVGTLVRQPWGSGIQFARG